MLPDHGEARRALFENRGHPERKWQDEILSGQLGEVQVRFFSFYEYRCLNGHKENETLNLDIAYSKVRFFGKNTSWAVSQLHMELLLVVADERRRETLFTSHAISPLFRMHASCKRDRELHKEHAKTRV